MSIGDLSTLWCLLPILFFLIILKFYYTSLCLVRSIPRNYIYLFRFFFEANVKETDCLPHLWVFLSFYIERLLLFMLFSFDMCVNFMSCYFAVQYLSAAEVSRWSLLCIKSYHFQAMKRWLLLSYLQTFPFCLPLVPFTCLSVLVKTSDTTLSMYGETILVFFLIIVQMIWISLCLD